MENEKIIIKRKGDDGSKVITIRIKEELLHDLDKIASESNSSRNEIINLLLLHGVRNVEIQ